MYAESEKVARKILDALNVMALSPEMVGKVLAETQGPMKYRIYKIVRSIILMWEIEVKHERESPENKEIYDWVKGLHNGKH